MRSYLSSFYLHLKTELAVHPQQSYKQDGGRESQKFTHKLKQIYVISVREMKKGLFVVDYFMQKIKIKIFLLISNAHTYFFLVFPRP